MHDICREAEMSPGALYRYFPLKEALIEAIAERDRINDLRNMARMGEGPTLIDGFINSVMAHFKDHHARGMVPPFTEIRAELIMPNANGCRLLPENRRRVHPHIRGISPVRRRQMAILIRWRRLTP